MADKALFDTISYTTSRLTTLKYSTSFSLGIRFLQKRFQEPIFNIYGFVRFADEIVDTFHDYDRQMLLDNFKEDTYRAIDRRISLNPILNSFQKTVHEFGIDTALIDTFLASMQMDLEKSCYERKEEFEEYIVGSAEVVGLMCLRVFCDGDDRLYQSLEDRARRLGAAFQKINFLRDLKDDTEGLNRIYFPNLAGRKLDHYTKREIERDIETDFDAGLQGIMELPKSSRFGVYLAYIYYKSLLKKIKKAHPDVVLQSRLRVPNIEKLYLLFNSYLRHNLNILG
jgi:15-cis-phytoene synthase